MKFFFTLDVTFGEIRNYFVQIFKHHFKGIKKITFKGEYALVEV